MKQKGEWLSLLDRLPRVLKPRSGNPHEIYDRGVLRIKYYRQSGILGGHDNVLDIGCGGLPTAIGLEQDGHFKSYVGIDVQKCSVHWGGKCFGKDQRFQFIHADVKSDRYSPKGFVEASKYKLPFGKNRFDLVSCNSLFTHIGTPAEARQYLDEMWRVMKPGAYAYATWYRSPPYEVDYGHTRSVFRERDVKNFLRYFEVDDLGGCTEKKRLMKDQWKLVLRKPEDAK